MTDRIKNEIEHGKKLAEGGAESIWGWNSPAGRERATRRSELIMAGAKMRAGMEVLEIGCGTGNFTEVFAASGSDITAVDISPDLLELAYKRDLDPAQVKFLEGRFEEIVTVQKFDAIIGSSVLHHLEMQAAIETMYRLLKPGGVLSFAEPNMMNPQVYAMFNFEFLKEKFGVSPDERAFYRWQLERQIAESGFIDVLIKPFDFLHPSTPPGLIKVVNRLGKFIEALPVMREFAGSLYIFARKPVYKIGVSLVNDKNQHQEEIEKNILFWNKKPILREIYRDFHKLIAAEIANITGLKTVELGSGIGNIKDTIPNCLRTDLFPNPWIDQVENAYELSFSDGSLSDLILFDVFHHLQYPGTALQEFWRVLAPGGRVIIFDPAISLLGMIVYGCFHPEALGLLHPIAWSSLDEEQPNFDGYYAAQGNATRIFWGKKYDNQLSDWKIVKRTKYSAISYILSGGYSKPQIYPDRLYPLMKKLDQIGNYFPLLFATRLFVVLEKL